jgi:hypothetical protein
MSTYVNPVFLLMVHLEASISIDSGPLSSLQRNKASCAIRQSSKACSMPKRDHGPQPLLTRFQIRLMTPFSAAVSFQ